MSCGTLPINSIHPNRHYRVEPCGVRAADSAVGGGVAFGPTTFGGSVLGTDTLLLHSASGRFSLSWFRGKLWDWVWTTRSSQEFAREQEEVAQLFARMGRTMQPASSFAFRWSDHHFYVRSPHWFRVALFGISAALCGIPWVKWHFSLRTLLIATTLVAVGLGIVAVFS
jgi:hypothetical protein